MTAIIKGPRWFCHNSPYPFLVQSFCRSCSVNRRVTRVMKLMNPILVDWN